MLFNAVLFDLDGTLLPLDVEVFLQDYIKAVSAKVAPFTEPKTFVKQLLYATEKMIADKNPDLTNEEVFWRHFLQGISEPHETLIPVLDEFYEKDFAQLGEAYKGDGEAAELIRQLKSKGKKVALATNAIFPRQAVVERIRWANLDPEDFEVITTFENMHFCKPHIEYYQEVLKHLGEEPENCIMVGNDIEEDIVAGKLGMTTFLLDSNFVIDRGSKTPYDYRGDLNLLRKVLGLA